MSSMRQHVYFADLNCPFCYALDERIHALGLTGVAVWQGVEHLTTPEQWQTESSERLEEEVKRVRRRAPELVIRVPPRRPASGPATLVLAELGLNDVAAGSQLRRALYRALWVDGRDISSHSVIAELCHTAGMSVRRPSPLARALVERWQKAWEEGGFDRSIPVLVAPGGARSIGLEESRRVAAFLKAGLLSSESDDSCRGAKPDRAR